MRILAIETSCDETAVAIVKDGPTVEYSAVSSQIALHRPFGGVVPEVASRAHQEWLPSMVAAALQETGYSQKEIDAIAATRGPGLIGALLVGVSFAKAFALGWNKPWIGVSHLDGHLASLDLADPPFLPPYVALLVSGGHTEYFLVKEDRSVKYLGGTLDDAAGEAFDKVSHLLNLGYPGGPAIQKAAEKYKGQDYYRFTEPMKGQNGCDVSFSGLKTAVLVALQKAGFKPDGHSDQAPYWAASFQQVVVATLVNKLLVAAEMAGCSRIALVGGVAANAELRRRATQVAQERGLELGISPLKYCGDNAAMIGVTALHSLHKGMTSPFDLDADPNLFPSDSSD